MIFIGRKEALKAVFGGTFTHSVDEKGRVVMPAKFKKGLGLNFIVTAGYDNTLMIMTEAEWDKFTARFENAPPSKVRWIRRFFQGNQHDASLDKQGRMQIPQQLRELIGVDNEVVLVGNGNMIEVWTPENWNANQYMLESDAIVQSMDDLVF